jgi:uncharacterized membrane protein
MHQALRTGAPLQNGPRLATSTGPRFPRAAGVLFGIGLGGFFDGIVFHQLLQWHHMLSSRGHPPGNLQDLQINTFWDGLFHATTYLFIVAGLAVLWRAGRRSHLAWSTRALIGTLLLGWGGFNLVEGLVNHHLLGLHHVNETVDPSSWLAWDLGFLAWGAVMLIAGWLLAREKTPGG